MSEYNTNIIDINFYVLIIQNNFILLTNRIVKKYEIMMDNYYI